MDEASGEYPEFELFVRGGTEYFIEGERRLVEQGSHSVAKLRALLSGEARNRFGVPYRNIGQSITCALETIRRLGPIAKDLEPFVLHELRDRRHTAAMALGALGKLSDASVSALSEAMESNDPDLSMESAVALATCGAADYPESLGVRRRLAGTRAGDYIERAIAKNQR